MRTERARLEEGGGNGLEAGISELLTRMQAGRFKVVATPATGPCLHGATRILTASIPTCVRLS